MELKNEIRNILLFGKGDSFDDAYNMYNIICKESDLDEQVSLFKYICENYGLEESNESFEVEHAPYKNMKEDLKEQYGAILNSVLKSYLKENLEEIDFYTKLWRTITESYPFDSDSAKVFAVYYTIIDKRIPYFKLDEGCKYQLSNEKYRKLRDKYKKEILKTRFILSTELSQRTEKASLLLNELGIIRPMTNASQEEIDNYEKLLMIMVEIFPEKQGDVLMQLLQRLSKK